MNTVEKSILDRFKAMLADCVPLECVILFGSRARGDAVEDSDMDVVVILDGQVDETARDAVSECSWAAGFDSGIIIVPVVFSKDEWDRGPERSSLLSIAARAEGVVI